MATNICELVHGLLMVEVRVARAFNTLIEIPAFCIQSCSLLSKVNHKYTCNKTEISLYLMCYLLYASVYKEIIIVLNYIQLFISFQRLEIHILSQILSYTRTLFSAGKRMERLCQLISDMKRFKSAARLF